MSNQLIRLIKLIQKTGDKLVIYDPTDSLEPYVIMGIADYETLLATKSEIPLTDSDLSDKISFVNDISFKEEDFVENKPNFNNSRVQEDSIKLPENITPEFYATEELQKEPEKKAFEPVAKVEEIEVNLPWQDVKEEEIETTEEKIVEEIQGNEEMIEKAGLKSLGSVLETRLEELQKRMNNPLSRFND